MKSQLSILLATMQANWVKLTATIAAFLMPISGLLFLVGFVIALDTITGVWKSIKRKVPITSRGLSAIISKMLLYEVTVIMFYMIDAFSGRNSFDFTKVSEFVDSARQSPCPLRDGGFFFYA